MNKIHQIISVLVFLLVIGCKAHKVEKNKFDCLTNKQEIKNFMKNEIEQIRIEGKSFVHLNLLKKSSIDKLPIEHLYNSDYFSLIKNLHVKSKEDFTDYSKIFSEEDFDYMKCQIRESQFDKWSKILGEKYFSEKIKDSKDFLFYSLPVISKNGEFIFVYYESAYGGGIKAYKKLASKWKFFAYGLIWVE